MKKLDKNELSALVCGSSIFGTGGGFTPTIQKQAFDELLKQGNIPELVSLTELGSDDFICAVYGIGPAGAATEVSPQVLRKALHALEKEVGGKVVAFFPGETGIESFVFQIAAQLGKQVVDADATGGRAVPEVQIDNFVLLEKSTQPLIAATTAGEITLIDGAPDLATVEKELRTLASQSDDGVLCIFDHVVSVSEASGLLTQGVISRSIELGQALLRSKSTAELKFIMRNKASGISLLQGEIVESQLTKTGGFLMGQFSVQSREQYCTVHVKNENIALTSAGQVLASAPDLIVVIDSDTGMGLHSSVVKDGAKVIVFRLPAVPLWSTPQAKALFSPAELGIDLNA